MMYIPHANAVDDPSVVVDLLRAGRVGHLVSCGADGFDSTLVPFLVDDAMTALRVHLARANAHWRVLDDQRVILVVPVTDAYVSPSWYPSKQEGGKVVPTWNYEVVHVHGTAVVRDDADFVAAVVRELTDRHETERLERDGGSPWSVDDAPAEYVERQLRAIVGVEVQIEHVEAKRKLSQNRSTEDRGGVVSGLTRSSRPGDLDVALSMRTTD